MNAREAAMAILSEWQQTKKFPDRSIASLKAQRGFVTELVYGVVKQRRLLDWIIDGCVTRHPGAQARVVLWVGIYQQLWMDRTAAYAAVNETVELAKRCLSHGEVKFVNAILRRIGREREQIESTIAGLDLGLRSSHPDALTARWEKTFGPTASALCEWNNSRPDTVVRPMLSRTTMEAFTGALAAEGIEASPHPFRPGVCLVLPRATAVPSLPGFAEGLFTVQDPSTLAAVDLLAPQAGESILDACAAPGGKTAVIADQMRGEGRLVANERHQDRLLRLRQNIERLKLDWVEITTNDARTADPEARYDGILLDVPCTNTGVLRRRADARWRFDEERLASAGRLQRALLDAAAESLAPNGRIVYSTCSLEPEENGERITAWLAEHPGFRLAEEQVCFPPETKCDGAYAARLERA